MQSKLIDHTGRPISSAEIQAVRQSAFPTQPKPQAALSGAYKSAFPYDAASWFTPESEGWFPYVYSPDHEINVYRDRMVGRVRDLVRNDGWASGAITRITDSTIGGHYRLVAKPDWRLLKLRTPGAAFDAVWAEEFRHAVEANWRSYEEDVGRWNDAKRKQTVSQMFHLALRHKLIDGETLGSVEWWPERVGYGAARYATCLHLIDPDRLSNPNQMIDTLHRRGGVQLDDAGAVTGYHIRRAHQMDWYGAAESMIWDYRDRETEFGRPIMLHDMDLDRAEQHRGLGVFVPIVNRMKMLTRYDAASLQAAVISAVFSLAIQSPYDPEGMKALLDGDTSEGEELSYYEGQRQDYRRGRPISLEGATILNTFPGEEVKPVMSSQPSPQYDQFTHAMLRHVAAQLGTTAEQVTQDWSKANYSSLRGAAVEAGKTISRRKKDFDSGFANPYYCAWLEESMETDDLPLPEGAPDFIEVRSAYSRCSWIGTPLGWVDPVKEIQGATMRMDAGVSTLQDEAAAQGKDWEEMLAQRAIERKRMAELGLPQPAWIAGVNASEDIEKPEAQ